MWLKAHPGWRSRHHGVVGKDHSGWSSAVAVWNTATAEGNSSNEEKKTWARNQPVGDVSQLYNINSLCGTAETMPAG